MSMLNTFTIDDIRSWNPCYDPCRYLPEGWSGTALDIIAVEACPANDRLWVVLREECIDPVTLDTFGRWCLRDASGAAAGARSAAWDSARSAAWIAARAAAWDAAWDATGDSAREIVSAAVRYAANGAVKTVAWDAARDAQIAKLKEMLNAL